MKQQRPVVRLTVVELEHVCPHGRGFAPHNLRKLVDCYLDSATPGHYCSHPVLPEQRCDRVAEARKRTGWRSYKLVPMLYGEARAEDGKHSAGPRLIYTPLNREGTEWMAINITTGEKKEVDLAASIFDPKITGTALVTRRFTTHGENLNELEGWTRDKPQPRRDCPSCQHSREPGGCYWHRNGLPYPGFTEPSYRRTGDEMVKKGDMDTGGRGETPGRVVERSPASVYFPNNKPGAAPEKPRRPAPSGTVEALANAQKHIDGMKRDKVKSTASLISDEMKKKTKGKR